MSTPHEKALKTPKFKSMDMEKRRALMGRPSTTEMIKRNNER
jgi:hypothetical protein